MTESQSTVDEAKVDGAGAPDDVSAVPQKKQPRRWGVALAAVVVVFALGAGLGWLGLRQARKEKNSLRVMREAVEAALAPGEVVIVDDSLLGWALRRGSDGVLRQSVWTVSEGVSASSLLSRLEESKRREVVVVATPEDRLIQDMDAAGFSVAQEVGWVPWDLKGNGRALLGRGKMRIYFAVVPRPAVAPVAQDALRPGEAVSSSSKSKRQR